jgi:hypothetical protein
VSFSKTCKNALLLTSVTLVLGGCSFLENMKNMVSQHDKSEQNVAGIPAPFQDDAEFVEAVNAINNPNGIDRDFLRGEVAESLNRIRSIQTALNSMQQDVRQVVPPAQRIEAMKLELDRVSRNFENILGAVNMPALQPEGELVTASQTNGMTQEQDMMMQNGHSMQNAMPSPMATNRTASGTIAQRPMTLMQANPQGEVNRFRASPILEPQTQRAAQAMATATPQQQTKAPLAPQVQPGMTGLVGVRVGEHADRTRLVLDMAAAVDIRYDLDTSENILVVELPGQSANNVRAQSFPRSALIKGYDIQQSGGNTLVIFMFKKPTQLIETMQLKGKGNAAHRYVFDMRK